MNRWQQCQETMIALANSASRQDEKGSDNRLINLLLHLHQQNNVEVLCDVCANTGVEGSARAYLSLERNVKIILCANRLQPQDIPEVLIHEAVHAYDFLHNPQINMQTIEGLAYSEVRAAREAECAKTWSVWKDRCIRGKAAEATHNVFSQHGQSLASCRESVDRVFDKANADLKPWS
eukprot:gene5931-6529_t